MTRIGATSTHAVWVHERVAVDAVVADIEFAVQEPRQVPLRERPIPGADARRV